MNETMSQLSDHRQQAMNYIQGLPEGEGCWLMGQRRAALSRFTELGFPDSRQEAWRYTSVDGLLQQGFSTADGARSFSEPEVRRAFLAEPVAARLVLAGAASAEMADSKNPNAPDLKDDGKDPLVARIGWRVPLWLSRNAAEVREAEALDWAESTIADVADETR